MSTLTIELPDIPVVGLREAQNDILERLATLCSQMDNRGVVSMEQAAFLERFLRERPRAQVTPTQVLPRYTYLLEQSGQVTWCATPADRVPYYLHRYSLLDAIEVASAILVPKGELMRASAQQIHAGRVGRALVSALPMLNPIADSPPEVLGSLIGRLVLDTPDLPEMLRLVDPDGHFVRIAVSDYWVTLD